MGAGTLAVNAEGLRIDDADVPAPALVGLDDAKAGSALAADITRVLYRASQTGAR